MPCLPPRPPAPPAPPSCPFGELLFQCTQRMKVAAHICEVPVPDCLGASYPTGLELSVAEIPSIGADNFVSAFRITDCRNGKKTRVELFSAWDGQVKVGVGAIIPQRDEAAAIVGAFHNDLGQTISGSVGVLGKMINGKVYAGYFEGDVLVTGAITSGGSITVDNGSSAVEYTTEDGTIAFLYRDATGLLCQGVGAAIEANNGASALVGVLTDANGTYYSDSFGYVGYQLNGNRYGFYTPGDSYVGGDLTVVGDIVDANGNSLLGGGSGDITTDTTITSTGGTTTIWQTGEVNLGGAYTTYPTGVALEGTVQDGSYNSVMEILCENWSSRVSFHPNSGASNAKQAMWVLAPKSSTTGAIAGLEVGFSDGTYYGQNASLPVTHICLRDAANQYYGVWTNSNLYVGGNATLAGSAIGAWADYVFAEDYELPLLADVMAYARSEKHLPGIPSSEDIAKNDLNIGAFMSASLALLEQSFLYIEELATRIAVLEG